MFCKFTEWKKYSLVLGL